MSEAEIVIQADEIFLASRDPGTGAPRRSGRFKVEGGVQPALQGLNPPVIAIGETGRDTQAHASSLIWEDVTGGIGVYRHKPAGGTSRVWWSTNDIRQRGKITLPRKKTDRSAPTGNGTRQPRAGGVFNDTVYVAWDERVHSYTDAAGWSASLRTLTGSATPQGEPLEWESGWFWPLGGSGIDVWNGTAWFNVAKSCVGLLVYANTLWGVGSNGQVFSTNITASAAATKIAAATLVAADFTDRVKVSDVASGLFLFNTNDAGQDVVPYVIGARSVYQVDPSSFEAAPAGPLLPPYVAPIRATSVTYDQAAYIAQGLGVVQWPGATWQDVGPGLDDGVPADYRGVISHLAAAGTALVILIDATQAVSTAQGIFDTMQPESGVLAQSVGYSWLADRAGLGWRVRAMSDANSQAPTCLFVSAAGATFRLWFGWGGLLYTLELEQGIVGPLDDPTAEYEASGTTILPLANFGYYEHPKLGTVVALRTDDCSATETVSVYIQYDEGGAWYPLYDAAGVLPITTNGRHEFPLAANPVPTSLSPRTFADEPPVGKTFENAQLRFDLARGATTTATPLVEFVALHANKRQPRLEAWMLTVDCSATYNGLTPAQQRALLIRLIQDNFDGMLHFAYRPEESATGAPDVRAVDVIGHAGLDRTGLPKDYRGRIFLRLAEVRSA